MTIQTSNSTIGASASAAPAIDEVHNYYPKVVKTYNAGVASSSYASPKDLGAHFPKVVKQYNTVIGVGAAVTNAAGPTKPTNYWG